MSQHTEQHHQRQKQNYGVLLYYKYASIPDLDRLLSFYQSNCTSLSLLGRVRLAPHGVNVTVGGQLSSLERHVNAVKSMPLFEGTDFKLATCNQPLNDKVARECGFTSLSIRIVEELVTFSSHPLLKSPKISNAGTHLSAVEFHAILQEAVKLSEDHSPRESEGIVLLDARNLYETRIGKFQTPGVETLDPETRQYSDLHAWIDNNSDCLKGKQILMYCTGGIRCEMASAYIKGKGIGYENVYQLYGGIQRYLEQFPSGFQLEALILMSWAAALFATVPLMIILHVVVAPTVECLFWFAIAARYVVYKSNGSASIFFFFFFFSLSLTIIFPFASSKPYNPWEQIKGGDYICELCRKHSESVLSNSATEYTDSKVLFHQTDQTALQLPNRNVHAMVDGCTRKLRILCLHGFRQNASSFKGRTASLAKKLKNLAELVFVDAPHELPFIYQPSAGKHCESETSIEHRSPPKVNCNRKFAWLVDPDYSGRSEADWKVADGPFDPFQYQHQTGGLDVSMAYLKSVFVRDGPFDGILGFSQGAAMAALVCAKRDELKSEMSFRFAILCSGFSVRLQEFVQTPINCPSLHIFGHDHGKDRQISNEVSKNLVAYFEDGSSVVIRHDSGHIIPTRPPYIDEIKDFLKRFL